MKLPLDFESLWNCMPQFHTVLTLNNCTNQFFYKIHWKFLDHTALRPRWIKRFKSNKNCANQRERKLHRFLSTLFQQTGMFSKQAESKTIQIHFFPSEAFETLQMWYKKILYRIMWRISSAFTTLIITHVKHLIDWSSNWRQI